jgi:hypothetical protein
MEKHLLQDIIFKDWNKWTIENQTTMCSQNQVIKRRNGILCLLETDTIS